MENYTIEFLKRGFDKKKTGEILKTKASTITQQVGSLDEPKKPRQLIELGYQALLLRLDMRNYGVTLKELIGLEETGITHKFREFLRVNAKNKEDQNA